MSCSCVARRLFQPQSPQAGARARMFVVSVYQAYRHKIIDSHFLRPQSVQKGIVSLSGSLLSVQRSLPSILDGPSVFLTTFQDPRGTKTDPTVSVQPSCATGRLIFEKSHKIRSQACDAPESCVSWDFPDPFCPRLVNKSIRRSTIVQNIGFGLPGSGRRSILDGHDLKIP